MNEIKDNLNEIKRKARILNEVYESFLNTDIIRLVNETEKLINKSVISDSLLSAKYLTELHTNLCYDDAVSLLKYCFDNTIKRKECYGNGNIMLPLWKKSIES